MMGKNSIFFFLFQFSCQSLDPLISEDRTIQQYENSHVLYHEQILPGVALNITDAEQAKRSIWIDAQGYGAFTRILLEIYDWDGDFQADFIRVTHTKKQEKKIITGHDKTVMFYHGPQMIRRLIEKPGNPFPTWRGKSVPMEEMGLMDYMLPSSQIGGRLTVTPKNNQKVKALFSLADQLLKHSKMVNQPFSKIDSFLVEIKAVLDWEGNTYQ